MLIDLSTLVLTVNSVMSQCTEVGMTEVVFLIFKCIAALVDLIDSSL